MLYLYANVSITGSKTKLEYLKLVARAELNYLKYYYRYCNTVILLSHVELYFAVETILAMI